MISATVEKFRLNRFPDDRGWIERLLGLMKWFQTASRETQKIRDQITKTDKCLFKSRASGCPNVP